ncbi:MAG TPA: sigma-70 family RNA polymerase sigma factor [Thermoanaerobaculia bacterium]|nr:sigma-70 family RNA polymerase sigma factor [Thermoanaerobaculia bacterium]
MDATEQDLVEAAKKDPARFAPLYEEHFARVYAFIVRRVRDRSLAEDLTAEVFRRALGGIGGFEWRGVPFAAWLFRIAANEIAGHAGRAARESGAHVPEPAAPGEDEIEAVERRATLFRLVDELPPDQRHVVVMRFTGERSIREIARELGRSEGAVKQLQWRALQTLRTRMSERNG